MGEVIFITSGRAVWERQPLPQTSEKNLHDQIKKSCFSILTLG